MKTPRKIYLGVYKKIEMTNIHSAYEHKTKFEIQTQSKKIDMCFARFFFPGRRMRRGAKNTHTHTHIYSNDKVLFTGGVKDTVYRIRYCLG
jgi:hypothetical protein